MDGRDLVARYVIWKCVMDQIYQRLGSFWMYMQMIEKKRFRLEDVQQGWTLDGSCGTIARQSAPSRARLTSLPIAMCQLNLGPDGSKATTRLVAVLDS